MTRKYRRCKLPSKVVSLTTYYFEREKLFFLKGKEKKKAKTDTR